MDQTCRLHFIGKHFSLGFSCLPAVYDSKIFFGLKKYLPLNYCKMDNNKKSENEFNYTHVN